MRSSVLQGMARNRINGNMNIMGMTFSQCFNHPAVQSPKFQFHSHIRWLPTVLTEKTCVKRSGCCISMLAKAWPDLCCAPLEWAKTNRWVEQRKRCGSVCPEHPSSESDHLASYPLGRFQERRRKRESGANIGRVGWEEPWRSDNLMNEMWNLPVPADVRTLTPIFTHKLRSLPSRSPSVSGCILWDAASLVCIIVVPPSTA